MNILEFEMKGLNATLDMSPDKHFEVTASYFLSHFF